MLIFLEELAFEEAGETDLDLLSIVWPGRIGNCKVVVALGGAF